MTDRQNHSSGEDSLITRYFGPLATDPGAFGLGDDAAVLKALGDDIVSLITQTLKPTSQQVADFEAFVITGEGANFSSGGDFAMIEAIIDDFETRARVLREARQAVPARLPRRERGCPACRNRCARSWPRLT